ncbi:MAG TPA: hypothetical protein VGU63_07330, partial [Candidatus Acidoferrales bacterium]|nr:hypothetical protein [Candidatus Acidoferrales bacterium]
VLRMVVWRGVKLAGIGVGLGMAGALSGSYSMRALIFGVAPDDPWTFAAVAALLIFVALAACYLPARRAMRVDPMVALRYE